MSKLRIFGVAGSRAGRCLWMANELGLDYEHVPVHFANGGTRTPEYLAINPNGHIPAIDDDGLRLWESMAINLYLAKKHGSGPGGLYPSTLEGEALAWQWSFWAVNELERHVITAILNRAVYPEEKRDPAAADAAERELAAPFKVLDQALRRSAHLLGEPFTVADLNVASVLSFARPAKVDFSAVPTVDAWLRTCLQRPAAVRARKQ